MYYRFPRDPTRKKKWVNAVRREDSWIPTKHSQICSLHFVPVFFNINCNKQTKLLKDAVPTLYLPVYSQEIQSNELKCPRKQLHTPTDPTLNSPSNEEKSHNRVMNHTISFQKDTPRNLLLNKKIQERGKKIKRLQYHNRRLKKKVAQLEYMLNSITEKSYYRR